MLALSKLKMMTNHMYGIQLVVETRLEILNFRVVQAYIILCV